MVLGKVDIHIPGNEFKPFRKLKGNAHDLGLGNNFRKQKYRKQNKK